MKNFKTSSETLFALGAICCLLFMRYYETSLYYGNINLILDTFYGFVAIPLFYFLVSACLAGILIKRTNIKIAKTAKNIYKLMDIFLLIVFMIFLILKLLGYITVGIVPFISLYWIVFIAWGCIFTVDFIID